MLPFFISDEMGFSDEELLLMCAASGGKTVEDTATGNPLTFTTDIAKPLKSLLIPFTPQQEGTGDPSPQNIRSILPWNGLTVFGGGKNLYQFDEENITMAKQADQQTRAVYLLNVPAGTYTLSAEYKTSGDYPDTNISIGRIENDVLSLIQSVSVTYDRTVQISTGQTLCFMSNSSERKFSENLQKYNLMLVVGSTAESYVPPTITETDIVFPSAVYGGTLDVVSGVLTVEWYARIETGQRPGSWSSTETATLKRWVLNKGEFEKLPKASGKLIANYFKNSTAGTRWNAFFGSTSNFLCYIPLDQFPTKDSWLDYLAENPLQIVYELDEPYEVQLTPAQLTAIIGNNTVWSDADGQMTAVYLKKG